MWCLPRVRCRRRRRCGGGIIDEDRNSFSTQVCSPLFTESKSFPTIHISLARHPLGPHPQPPPPRLPNLNPNPKIHLRQQPRPSPPSLHSGRARLRPPARGSAHPPGRQKPAHLRRLHALECSVYHATPPRLVSGARNPVWRRCRGSGSRFDGVQRYWQGGGVVEADGTAGLDGFGDEC